MELFNPHEFNTPVHIIGVGATGSWVALQLAKLGVTNITVWDDDIVEEHNIPNQAFNARATSGYDANGEENFSHIGRYKVEALSDVISYATDSGIKVKHERVTNQVLSGIVFLMVDSMSARKEIWEKCLRYKPAVKHVIEPRMGLHVGRVYNVNPLDPTQIKGYEATYYTDEEADASELSACGNSMTVITSAMMIAASCVRQFINFNDGTQLDNEILYDFQYNNIFPTKWK
jgi:molybdopterin/thiamine biosynthesis adenylyltransferase